MTKIKKVGVVGAGAMGAQIAVVAALHHYDVVLQDIAIDRLVQAKEVLETQLDKRVKKGRFSAVEVNEAFQRLTFTTEIKQLHDADIVIEAIIEDLDAKLELFQSLEKIVSEDCILATNSSTIVSSKLIEGLTYQNRVCNIHFFNPVLVMELVEVVQGPHTSTEIAEQAMQFVASIGKQPVLLQKEISGFIANRILARLMDEALTLYENGYASFAEIDLVVEKALGHPIGPFALMDLTGLDVNYAVRKQRFKETGLEIDRPKQSVIEKVEKGDLGRKTGRGWYTYDQNGKKIVNNQS